MAAERDLMVLLAAFTHNDNDARRAAEQTYEGAKAGNPEGLAAALLGICNNADAASCPPHLRSLAAVLLRRLVSGASSEWGRMSEGCRETIKATLLYSITNGNETPVQSVDQHSQIILLFL